MKQDFQPLWVHQAPKETQGHITHHKSVHQRFQPSTPEDGDLNSSFGDWGRLWRTEHLTQSLGAWAGLPHEGRKEKAIWRRKERSKVMEVRKKRPAFWRAHLMVSRACLHSVDMYKPLLLPPSGNATTGKVPTVWELTDQWGCQTMNSNQQTKDDRQWCCWLTGWEWLELLQVPIQLGRVSWSWDLPEW